MRKLPKFEDVQRLAFGMLLRLAVGMLSDELRSSDGGLIWLKH